MWILLQLKKKVVSSREDLESCKQSVRDNRKEESRIPKHRNVFRQKRYSSVLTLLTWNKLRLKCGFIIKGRQRQRQDCRQEYKMYLQKCSWILGFHVRRGKIGLLNVNNWRWFFSLQLSRIHWSYSQGCQRHDETLLCKSIWGGGGSHVQVDIKVEDFLWDRPANICGCGLLFSNKSHLFSLGHEIPRMRRKAGWVFACLYLPCIAVSLYSARPFTPSHRAVDLSRDSSSLLLLSRQNTDTFSVSLYLLQMFCSSCRIILSPGPEEGEAYTAHLGMLKQCLLKHSRLIPVYCIPHALFYFHSCLQILMSLDLLSIHEVNGIVGGNEVVRKQLWIKRITGIFHVHKCLQPSWRGSKASACKQ